LLKLWTRDREIPDSVLTIALKLAAWLSG